MFGTNRIAQTSRENPVESLRTIGVNRTYPGVNYRWYLPLLDDGISLISVYQRRGNRHACGAETSGQVPVGLCRESPRTDRGCDGEPLWEDHSRICGGQALSCGRLDRRCSGSAITSSLGCTKWGRCFASAIRTDLVPSYPDDGTARSAFPHHSRG